MFRPYEVILRPSKKTDPRVSPYFHAIKEGTIQFLTPSTSEQRAL